LGRGHHGLLLGQQKTGRAKMPKPGPRVPGLLATCFTWLQAGRLK
jgi:hypothetical protein